MEKAGAGGKESIKEEEITLQTFISWEFPLLVPEVMLGGGVLFINPRRFSAPSEVTANACHEEDDQTKESVHHY